MVDMMMYFTTAPDLGNTHDCNIWPVMVNLPDSVFLLHDFDIRLIDLADKVGELTTVSLFVTCPMISYFYQPICQSEDDNPLYRTAFVVYEALGSREKHYLRIPFARLPLTNSNGSRESDTRLLCNPTVLPQLVDNFLALLNSDEKNPYRCIGFQVRTDME